MGINKYSSQLEAYFSGSMSETDRILFEGRVESNPMLKAEFDRQNDIVEGLKAHRTAELKTRLNNISVEPTLIGTLLEGTVMRAVTYSVSALLVATGSYFFYNKEAAIQYHLDSLKAQNEYTLGSQIDAVNFQSLDYRFKGNLQVMDFVDNTPVMKKRDLTNKSDQVNNIAFEVPEVGQSQEESFDGMSVNLDAMDRIDQVAGISEFDKVNIQTINSRRYNFHYRLEDNRLFLYGKFNESPYEIIEISTPGNKKLFFFYQGDFYQLNKQASAITPLSKIENRELIHELVEIKSRN